MRRVVASPAPLRVLGLATMARLLEAGTLVIAAGGGGIPVVRGADGHSLQGIDAVIDKDLCSVLLAQGLELDCLLMATDVDAVYLDWGQAGQHALRKTTPEELARHDFAKGSMAPKVRAGQKLLCVPTSERTATLARKAKVPVVGVTETQPANLSFQDWMLGQLDAVDRALTGPNS